MPGVFCINYMYVPYKFLKLFKYSILNKERSETILFFLIELFLSIRYLINTKSVSFLYFF